MCPRRARDTARDTVPKSAHLAVDLDKSSPKRLQCITSLKQIPRIVARGPCSDERRDGSVVRAARYCIPAEVEVRAGHVQGTSNSKRTLPNLPVVHYFHFPGTHDAREWQDFP